MNNSRGNDEDKDENDSFKQESLLTQRVHNSFFGGRIGAFFRAGFGNRGYKGSEISDIKYEEDDETIFVTGMWKNVLFDHRDLQLHQCLSVIQMTCRSLFLVSIITFLPCSTVIVRHVAFYCYFCTHDQTYGFDDSP